MDTPLIQDSRAWRTFTIAAFVCAAGMMAGGIFFMDATFAAKGFYAMASIMLVHTSITITKTLRDDEESRKLAHRLEEAKQERLLREVGGSDAL